MLLDRQRWQPPVPIAHRGSRVLWPENTLPAFSGAVEMGYAHVETDLHLSSDGVLVCFHDHTLERTTDGAGPVETRTLAELKRLDAGYRHRREAEFPFRGRGVEIPTLEELLTAFPDVSVIVDLKSDGLEDPLARLLDKLDAHERLIVGSFSDARLARFRQVTGGGVATSAGPTAARAWLLTSRVGRGMRGDAAALQIPTHVRGIRVVDAKLVSAARASGLQVHVWTVNTPPEMRRLLEVGVDGIITDRPDLLRDVMSEDGRWRG